MGGLVDIPLSRLTVARTGMATRVNSAGLIEAVAANTPRIDYDPATGACLGLLAEGGRTNLLLRSGAFDNAAWSKSASTVTVAGVSTPDGVVPACKLVENSGYAEHYIYQGRTGSNEVVTLSVYARPAERTSLKLLFSNFATESRGAVFNLTTKTVTVDGAGTDYVSVGAAITPAGGEWCRCALTVVKAAVNTTNNPLIALHDGSSTGYAGNGTSGLYIWGAQLETGYFPTSYIPTTSAAVSRGTDVITTAIPPGGWLPTAAGTAFVEMQHPGTGADSVVMQLDAAGAAVRIYRAWQGHAAAQVVTGAITTTLAAAMAHGQVTRAALAWDAVGCAFTTAGAAPVVGTSGVAPAGLSVLRIGSGEGEAFPFNGHIRRVGLYPRRLSSAELQSLTA